MVHGKTFVFVRIFFHLSKYYHTTELYQISVIVGVTFVGGGIPEFQQKHNQPFVRKWLILSQWEQFSTWGDKFPTINIKVKPVYKGHSMSFMGICSLYTGYNYVHYSLVGKMRLPFIDSDLLYGGVSL